MQIGPSVFNLPFHMPISQDINSCINDTIALFLKNWDICFILIDL